jgi:hypothetical protein
VKIAACGSAASIQMEPLPCAILCSLLSLPFWSRPPTPPYRPPSRLATASKAAVGAIQAIANSQVSGNAGRRPPAPMLVAGSIRATRTPTSGPAARYEQWLEYQRLEQLGLEQLWQPEQPWRSGWRLGLRYVQTIRAGATGLPTDSREVPRTSGPIFRNGATRCRSCVDTKNPPRAAPALSLSRRADELI